MFISLRVRDEEKKERRAVAVVSEWMMVVVGEPCVLLVGVAVQW